MLSERVGNLLAHRSDRLATGLAGALPLLLGLRDAWPECRAAAAAVVGLVAIAIALSLSKTAWITAALGLGLFWPAGRPLARQCRSRTVAWAQKQQQALHQQQQQRAMRQRPRQQTQQRQ